jgi:hypothetical protein
VTVTRGLYWYLAWIAARGGPEEAPPPIQGYLRIDQLRLFVTALDVVSMVALGVFVLSSVGHLVQIRSRRGVATLTEREAGQ